MSVSNTETPEPSSNIAPLDMDWAQNELVPFLQSVFTQPGRSADDWLYSINRARYNIHLIPFYEDFPMTIECLRLTLLNSETLTQKELSKFTKVADLGSFMCVRIFVRHASRHGPYPLFSLGRDPSPDFPRGDQARGIRPARTQPSQLADTNGAMRRQRRAPNVEAEGRRGGYVQTGRPPQLRGVHNGPPDHGHHFNQGARVSPTMQQPSPQYPPAPFGDYNHAYGGSQMAYTPYPSAPLMGGYGIQQYGNPPPQSYGGWTGDHGYHNAQEASSAQPGASSAYLVPPQQTMLVPQHFRATDRQEQPSQQYRAASVGQQGQVLAQHEDILASPQEQASVPRRASSSVLHPEARPFTPGSNTRDI